MNLERLCKAAAEIKSQFDLTGCDYGYHKRTQQRRGVLPHYYFLAAFARVTQAKDILEIGTHEGGSIKAFSRGAIPDCLLVTLDRNPDFRDDDCPNIVPLIGEAQDLTTLLTIQTRITAPIDILFIDSTHRYDHMKDVFWTYEGVFRPRYILLDDIKINAEMERFWRELCDLLGETTFDASELAARDTGLGLIARLGI